MGTSVRRFFTRIFIRDSYSLGSMKVPTAVPTAIVRNVTTISNLWRNQTGVASRTDSVACSDLISAVVLSINVVRQCVKGRMRRDFPIWEDLFGENQVFAKGLKTGSATTGSYIRSAIWRADKFIDGAEVGNIRSPALSVKIRPILLRNTRN